MQSTLAQSAVSPPTAEQPGTETAGGAQTGGVRSATNPSTVSQACAVQPGAGKRAALESCTKVHSAEVGNSTSGVAGMQHTGAVHPEELQCGVVHPELESLGASVHIA